MPPAPADPHGTDPLALLRSRRYVGILVLAAAVGVPVSMAAYGFLALVQELQEVVFDDLPAALGLDPVPAWWPLPPLVASGFLVALAIVHLPGTGGHSPADGFKPSSAVSPRELPGIALAALGTLSFGVVLGPEAPLILLGSGLGVLAVRLVARDAPPQAAAVIAAAGSFAAISSLIGSPLLGAFLLLEAAGLAGPMVGLVLVPGLLAAGIGSLIFLGLDSITGLGSFTLTIPGLPEFDRLTVAMFAWALVFGALAPFLGRGIQLLAVRVRAYVEPRMVLLMPVIGAAIALLAILFGEVSGEDSSAVLFSGQDAIGPLILQASEWSVGALLLLVVCKSLAYGLAMSSFRGGPVFPALFIGAAAGIAASHLPGLELIPGVAMGIGAMCTVMLKLPLTSTMLATVLLGTDGTEAMPVVIVAVVVAYVVSARITPLPTTPAEPSPDREDAARAAAV